MPRTKFSEETRLKVVHAYLSGKQSLAQICAEHEHLNSQTVYDWVRKFEAHGETALLISHRNRSYSAEQKQRAVEEYLNGKGSLRDICIKYNISSTKRLRDWIKQYNSNMKLADYDPKPEVYMATARRKTTIDERREIVEYCLSHDKNYKGAAEKYDVSYSQVYNWTRSYLASGLEGLKDNRGRRKADEELSELEKLRRENLRLKHQLEEERRAVELLKKVQEFEGRRYSEKGNKSPNT